MDAIREDLLDAFRPSHRQFRSPVCRPSKGAASPSFPSFPFTHGEGQPEGRGGRIFEGQVRGDLRSSIDVLALGPAAEIEEVGPVLMRRRWHNRSPICGPPPATVSRGLFADAIGWMDFEGCRKSMAGVRWPSSENGETLNSPTCTSRLHDRCIGSAIFIPIQYVLYQNRNRQRHSS